MPNRPAAALWRNRDYMLLWSGQLVSTLGSMASSIIYPLLILELTGSPAAAGIAGALRWIPYVIFSLPVGALIDRWDRKRVMILCDAGRAIAVGSIPVAVAFDALTLGQLYVATFVEGTLFVFFNIAEVAALPRVVPRAHLPEATAQNEAAFAAANIVGPSIGTFLYQSFGRAVPFFADAVSYVVSLISLVAIKATFQGEAAPRKQDLAAEIAEGLRWLWSKRLIRFMALLTGGVNLFSASMPLITIVLAKELGASDAQIGLIFSIGGVGGIVGSLVGGRIQRRFSFGQVIIGCMWMWTLTFAALMVSPSWILVGVLSALMSFFGPIYNVVQFSYRVALIPDALQGRVNSTFRLLAFGFMPVGAALSGWLIEAFGIRWAIGALCAFFVLLALATHGNRHVREAKPIEHATASN
jgi:predicted MFS family arabinose efflux permease